MRFPGGDLGWDTRFGAPAGGAATGAAPGSWCLADRGRSGGAGRCPSGAGRRRGPAEQCPGPRCGTAGDPQTRLPDDTGAALPAAAVRQLRGRAPDDRNDGPGRTAGGVGPRPDQRCLRIGPHLRLRPARRVGHGSDPSSPPVRAAGRGPPAGRPAEREHRGTGGGADDLLLAGPDAARHRTAVPAGGRDPPDRADVLQHRGRPQPGRPWTGVDPPPAAVAAGREPGRHAADLRPDRRTGAGPQRRGGLAGTGPAEPPGRGGDLVPPGDRPSGNGFRRQRRR